MKYLSARNVVLALASLALLVLAGCAQKPEEAEEITSAHFQQDGMLLWLYRSSEGVGMFSGTYRDVTTLIQEANLLGAFDAGIEGAGRGHWSSNRRVKRNLLIYVKSGVVPEGVRAYVTDRPDHVYYVDLRKLRASMPQVDSGDEYEQLKAEFSAKVQALSTGSASGN